MNEKINPYRKKKEKIFAAFNKLSDARDKLDNKEFALSQQWTALMNECTHEHTKTHSIECLGDTLEYTQCIDCGKTLNTTENPLEKKTETLWNSLRKKFWGRKY
jgi:hypothetical protein